MSAAKAALRDALMPMAVLAWFGLGMGVPLPSLAAAAEPRAASPAGAYTADLTYQETDEWLFQRPVGVKLQTTAFRKEPPLGRKDVFRGFLLWSARPEQATPFIWDKGRSRLYLDLNRNQDLADDARGIFTSDLTNNDQNFTNIHLAVPTAIGERPVRLVLSLYSYRAREMTAYARWCCYWQAKVNLRGTDWQFGLAADPLEDKTSSTPRYWFLRPWAERERPFHLSTGSPDFFDYTNRVFFGGQAYELDCRYDARAEPARYRVAFKEQSPPLGELKVTGADLHRLILTARRGFTVILDKPQGAMKLPVGTYSLEEIWLRKGEVEVLRTRAGKVTIDDRRAATLVAGGPLTNAVSVNSQHYNLQLNYKLLGAGGGTYGFARPDYQHPPEFAVFLGTNRLAGGRFKFG